ncbi:MAG: DMT family transporter [Alphaproteobacteria bacterium]|nr:DMT family transporter [Alphaproteobacteria bacterium]
MIAASLMFACMGLVVRRVSAQGVPTGEVLAWRTTVTTVVVAAVALIGGSSLRPVNVRMHLVRAVVGMVAMGCYFFTIGRLPLGDAVLLTYLSPVLVAALAPWTTGERVTRRVWAALVLGLAGVALVAGPHGASDPLGIASGLASAFFAALAYLSIRVLTRTDTNTTIVFWFSALGALMSAPAWLDGVVVPDVGLLFELVGIGVIGAIAQRLLTRAYALGEAAEVAVYSYATPVFAYVLGLLVLGEVPAAPSVVGTLLVVGAGALAARG